MSVLTQGNFGKFQKGGKSSDQAKKKQASLTKRLRMNLRFYPRHFTLDPRQKRTLFFTLPRAYELSLAFQHFIFMIPLQLFSAVLRMDLAGNLDPCHLTRYPKLMTYPGRKPFLF